MSIWFRVCPVGLLLLMSIPSGKSVAKIHADIMELVFIGIEESHCCIAVVGSWLGYSCCRWASLCVTAAKTSRLVSVHA